LHRKVVTKENYTEDLKGRGGGKKNRMGELFFSNLLRSITKLLRSLARIFAREARTDTYCLMSSWQCLRALHVNGAFHRIWTQI